MSDKESPETKRRRLEGVIPELLKRAVEIGVEKAAEAPDNLKEFIGGLRLPKEIVHYLFGQVEETKNGLFRVVAKEMRDFLEHTNLAGEMQKMLTTVQFEINTTIRFKPNERATEVGGSSEAGHEGREDGPRSSRPPEPLPKAEVSTDVHVSRETKSTTRERRRPRE